MTEGKPIPTELRNEEAALRQEIDLEDEYTAGSAPPVSIDIVLVRVTKFMVIEKSRFSFSFFFPL